MPEPPVAPASIPRFQRRHWGKQADWQWLFRAGRGNDPKVKNHGFAPCGDKLLVILAWRARGLGIHQVAKKTGVSHCQLSAVCKRFGVVPNVVIPPNSPALWGDYVAQEITAQAMAERAHNRAWRKAYRPNYSSRQMQRYYENHEARKLYSALKARERYHRIKHTPELKMKAFARQQLARIVRQAKGFTKSRRSIEYLGCTNEQAAAYIAAQFVPGMSWANYGTAWEIDHIKPLSSGNLLDPAHLGKVCHFTNLRPLWIKENRSRPKPRHLHFIAA